MIETPRLRFLEPIPIETEGQSLVILRDPYRFIDEPLTVSAPVYVLLTLMDGTRNHTEIQKQFRAKFGGKISAVDLEKLVEELDEHGLLETPRFEELRRDILKEFAVSPVRHAAHAGSAYDKNPDALRAQLDSFYKNLEPLSKEISNASIQGLVAPHIDPRVGGPCAARAFASLRNMAAPPELFVILGTAHQPSNSLYILTEKSFETPLGLVEVDRSVARALQEASPLNLRRDEYLHKHEHSVEFQLIFLQHLYQSLAKQNGGGDSGESHRFQILPILVGSFYEFIQTNTVPMSFEPVRTFTEALSDALKKSGKRVCIIAGADLSHMGRKFGDEEELSDNFIEKTRTKDHEMLDRAASGRSEAFFRFLQEDDDKQKVCGLPPIYTMLSLLGDNCKGSLLGYDLSVEEQTQSFVSFASMAFYR